MTRPLSEELGLMLVDGFTLTVEERSRLTGMALKMEGDLLTQANRISYLMDRMIPAEGERDILKEKLAEAEGGKYTAMASRNTLLDLINPEASYQGCVEYLETLTDREHGPEHCVPKAISNKPTETVWKWKAECDDLRAKVEEQEKKYRTDADNWLARARKTAPEMRTQFYGNRTIAENFANVLKALTDTGGDAGPSAPECPPEGQICKDGVQCPKCGIHLPPLIPYMSPMEPDTADDAPRDLDRWMNEALQDVGEKARAARRAPTDTPGPDPARPAEPETAERPTVEARVDHAAEVYRAHRDDINNLIERMAEVEGRLNALEDIKPEDLLEGLRVAETVEQGETQVLLIDRVKKLEDERRSANLRQRMRTVEHVAADAEDRVADCEDVQRKRVGIDADLHNSVKVLEARADDLQIRIEKHYPDTHGPLLKRVTDLEAHREETDAAQGVYRELLLANRVKDLEDGLGVDNLIPRAALPRIGTLERKVKNLENWRGAHRAGQSIRDAAQRERDRTTADPPDRPDDGTADDEGGSG